MSVTPIDHQDWDALNQPPMIAKHGFLATSGSSTLIAHTSGSTVLSLQAVLVAVQCLSGSAPAVASVTFTDSTGTAQQINTYAGLNNGANMEWDLKGIRTKPGTDVSIVTNSATYGADFTVLYQVIDT